MVATEREAYDLLTKLDVTYQTVEHPAITSVIDVPFELPGPQVKNLVLKSKKGQRIYLVILPDEKQADLKHLAAILNEKRLSFLSEDSLLQALNVPAGTVTPLALPNDYDKKITVVIDRTIDQNNTVGFHPNVNIKTVIMPFKEFQRVLTHLDYAPLYINV
ncbi:prolyl-tRNA editing protein [Vagococcus penaei]|uniref:Prolyl-tRNA editing protein n=1 Tax=Vagococcus penaei TaxID=633807 RepID=A0A1Q2D698_9ENTE|nr:YbaK/EbsC family protein [Vagococcus penaei]AQP53775.1 prolyl-tRNA editing protein [Vagococcus penaei]RSU00394.1 prolyl-tRNA editing protein [Vagococcus penaei]